MRPNKPSPDDLIEKASGLLPGKISKITSQKKSTTRFSLFIDDEFLIGVSDSTITRFDLKPGQLLIADSFEQIIAFEHKWKIKEYLLDLLSRRDHARHELRIKATKKGYSKDDITSILEELTAKGYINNKAFAKKFASDKFHFNNWGRKKIEIELLKKGLEVHEIEEALDQFGKEESEDKVLLLISKNRARFRRVDIEKRKKKIFDFLLRKGYDSESILKVLNKIDPEKL
ncbi:MAG: RecX family transcriptional regulator [Balneolales bacterium]|nr:RecX family transcriptional regulator [Balneolales bacterium]